MPNRLMHHGMAMARHDYGELESGGMIHLGRGFDAFLQRLTVSRGSAHAAADAELMIARL